MPGDIELFTSGAYAFQGLSVACAVAALAVAGIGSAILLRGRRSQAAVLFFGIAAAGTFWTLCSALMYASVEEATALWWARLAQMAGSFLVAASFQFAVQQLGIRRRQRGFAYVVWVVFGASGIAAAVTPDFIPGVHHRPFGFYPHPALPALLQVGAGAALLGACAILFWRAFDRVEARGQGRARAMALAYVALSLAFLDVLPAMGASLDPIGYVCLVGFMLIAGGALWRYQLVDLTPEYASTQILDTMKGAVVVADMSGTIRVANRATAMMLGYAPGELTGAHIRKIVQSDSNMNTGQILNSFGILEQTMAWQGAAGNRIDVLASSSFVRDADGTPMGVVYVASDFTERKRAEETLRENEHRYRTLFDLNPLPMWIYDFETLAFVAVNDAAVRHYGYSREEFLQMKISDIRPPEDVPDVLALLPYLPERVSPATFRHLTRDGRLIDVDVSSFEFLSGSRRSRLVIAQDVTERRRGEQLLRESEARYRLLFERNLAGVYRTTSDGKVLDCNEACARIFGFASRQEMLNASARSLYAEPSDRDRLIVVLREQRTLTNLESRMKRQDGSTAWVLENMTLLEGGAGDADVIEGTVIDITDRKYAQEEIEYQAYHDVLTGLPNRLLFRDRISVSLAHARRTTRTVAVMFLDLDDFKEVNDSLGHAMGDRLLQAIALRLVSSVRAEDTVARMGGDEFTVLLCDVADGRGVATVAQKILESLSQPVTLDQHQFRATASIGIALYPGDGFDAETLLKNADRAMYRAKQLGRNNFQYATPPPFDDRVTLQRRLMNALERDELIMHYQPIVEIATGAVVGAEALVRWHDPARGLLQPESFIPAAEESELILTIGEWVLRKSCAQMKEWHRQGHPDLRLSVNLSARQFQQRDLAEKIAAVLRETGFPGNRLELEITESTLMNNAESSLATMMALKSMGVRISIDDFGTGYSSLSYLRRFPIDTLKIDQEFVRDVTHDLNDQAIVTAVVSMARALKLRVVAEGVDTQAQLGFLQGEQCAEMQGFLYSGPVAPEDFQEQLRRSVSGASTDEVQLPSS